MTLICCIVKRRDSAFAFCRSSIAFLLPDYSILSSSCPTSSALKGTRYLLVTTASLSLLFYGFVAGGPVNFDSTTYNIARTMLFVAQGTIMPESVESLRQVLYELGHDMLCLPDICFYNLRGLGLLSSVEFVVPLGTVQHIVLLIWDGFFKRKPCIACLRHNVRLLSLAWSQ